MSISIGAKETIPSCAHLLGAATPTTRTSAETRRSGKWTTKAVHCLTFAAMDKMLGDAYSTPTGGMNSSGVTVDWIDTKKSTISNLG